MSSIGSRIKSIREKSGISQGTLAERAEIPIRTLQDIEYEKSKEPSFQNVAQVARALGISLDSFTKPLPQSSLTLNAKVLFDYVQGLEKKIETLEDNVVLVLEEDHIHQRTIVKVREKLKS